MLHQSQAILVKTINVGVYPFPYQTERSWKMPKQNAASPCAEEPQTIDDLIVTPPKPKGIKKKVPDWNGPGGLWDMQPQDWLDQEKALGFERSRYDDIGWRFRPDFKDMDIDFSDDVYEYMWTDYKEVGERLRSGVSLTEKQKRTYKAYLDALEPTYEDTLQYRGLHLWEKDIDNLMHAKKGDKINILQPLHTSNDFTWSDYFAQRAVPTFEQEGKLITHGKKIMMQIRVPRGVKTLVTNEMELEMVIAPGYKLEIIDAVDDFYLFGKEFEYEKKGFLGLFKKTEILELEKDYDRFILARVVSDKPLKPKKYPKGPDIKNYKQKLNDIYNEEGMEKATEFMDHTMMKLHGWL